MTVLSQVIESASITKKGIKNDMSISVFHRLVDSFIRITKNINDVKEFSIMGEPQLIILQLSKVSETSNRQWEKTF